MSTIACSPVGNGKVYLVAGGGKIYTDIAARFVKSERPVSEIISSEKSEGIIKNILDSNHLAALEFDTFIFGLEGFSRIAETQLVRKRMASYLIKSGKCELDGKRKFSVVIPEDINNVISKQYLIGEDMSPALGQASPNQTAVYHAVSDADNHSPGISVNVTASLLLEMINLWYEDGLKQGIPEENLRYMKPQATESKILVCMNAHALHDFFRVRLCRNASVELRNMAQQMLKHCRTVAPELFVTAGANCEVLGYCPENDRQHPSCRNRYPTKREAIKLIRKHWNEPYNQKG